MSVVCFSAVRLNVWAVNERNKGRRGPSHKSRKPSVCPSFRTPPNTYTKHNAESGCGVAWARTAWVTSLVPWPGFVALRGRRGSEAGRSPSTPPPYWTVCDELSYSCEGALPGSSSYPAYPLKVEVHLILLCFLFKTFPWYSKETKKKKVLKLQYLNEYSVWNISIRIICDWY
jgi:hypothetical protein